MVHLPKGEMLRRTEGQSPLSDTRCPQVRQKAASTLRGMQTSQAAGQCGAVMGRCGPGSRAVTLGGDEGVWTLQGSRPELIMPT